MCPEPPAVHHACVATSDSTTIIKFADDKVLLGLISNNQERVYPEEVSHLGNWCEENSLSKDFEKKSRKNYQKKNFR